jgi:hypothetical protein
MKLPNLPSIFRRKPDVIERRTNKFFLRMHESQAGRYRIISKATGRPLAVIDELRRAEDLVEGMERYVEPDEHEKKRRRIESMINRRKRNWIPLTGEDSAT